MNAFTSGPPSAILTSGRLESASSAAVPRPVGLAAGGGHPGRGQRHHQVADHLPQPGAGLPSGQTTSATPMAWTGPSAPPARTRAVEPSPNHW